MPSTSTPGIPKAGPLLIDEGLIVAVGDPRGARGWFIPIAHLLFSTTKMQGSLYRLAHVQALVELACAQLGGEGPGVQSATWLQLSEQQAVLCMERRRERLDRLSL